MSQMNPATVQFDPVRKQNYNLDTQGNPVYHGVPAGFQMTASGVLELSPDATVAQVQGWGVQSPCGPAELAAYEARLLVAYEQQAGLPQQSVVSSQQSVAPPVAPEPVHVVHVGDGGGGAEAN
jgi:hypothetical protein